MENFLNEYRAALGLIDADMLKAIQAKQMQVKAIASMSVAEQVTAMLESDKYSIV